LLEVTRVVEHLPMGQSLPPGSGFSTVRLVWAVQNPIFKIFTKFAPIEMEIEYDKKIT